MRIFERTNRDIRKLHVAFFIAAVLLLAATVWMIAADHHRPWKSYQSTFRQKIEPYISELQKFQKATVDEATAETAEQTVVPIPENRSSLGESLVRLPLVDAVDPSLEIEQIIQPELTLDYNFNRVPRVDRCVTCHQGIDQAAPCWPSEMQGLLPLRTTLELTLQSRESESATSGFFQPATTEPEETDQATKEESPETTMQRLGIALADRGMMTNDDVTVATITPRSPAAKAGLRSGDVIRRIGKTEVTTAESVATILNAQCKENDNTIITIKRGVDRPFCSHPRQELFVADDSPHPMAEFGCTVCHDGQGSATSFRWAAHTPTNRDQREAWITEHGWRPSTEWLHPMLPNRLVEASCLRCHMNVTDLAGNDRRLDPAAPKLLEGFRLVRDLGCYECHEIRGFDETGRQIGPDLRPEPRYSEVARALIRSNRLTEYQHELAARLTVDPFDGAARKQLIDSLKETKPATTGSANLLPNFNTLLSLLKKEQSPQGQYRNVGPSLRDAAVRLDQNYMLEQINDPSKYSQSPKMPQLFGIFGQLPSDARNGAAKRETVEIDAITHYLLTSTGQAIDHQAPIAPSTQPDEELFRKGKEQFGQAGCIACHRHDGWKGSDATIGPDLTSLAEKYSPGRGENWLRGRLTDPLAFNPRCRMPDPRLDAKQIDQLVAWLLPPSERISNHQIDPPQATVIHDLALSDLKRRMSESDAIRLLKEGLSAEQIEKTSGDIRILTAPIDDDKIRSYVGRTSIRRRGCAGCHEIPGLEDAVGIGPSLTGWGRKHPSLLAFESVNEYLTRAKSEAAKSDDTAKGPTAIRVREEYERAKNTDDWYFRQALAEGRREGFVWQKLRAPRSFDYKKADPAKPDDWLRMGRFDLTPAQIEAISTFVLGMVADPPETDRFLPDAKSETVTFAHGRNLLEHAGCIRCHSERLPRWEISADPDNPQPHYPMPDWPFLKPRIPPEKLADSRRTDLAGRVFARLAGRVDTEPGGEIFVDETLDGEPLYFFNLWQPVAIDGTIWTSGGPQVEVAQSQIVKQYPADGGQVVSTLFPILSRPNPDPSRQLVDHRTTYGRLPPTLEGEGCKVRSDWLRSYLRQPTTIRPQSVMNMPRYNLSDEEIDRLVDYVELTGRRSWQREQLAPGLEATLRQWNITQPQADDVAQWREMHDAMGMILDGRLDCRNCHLIGDRRPSDADSPTLAPNLENVSSRLQPTYLLRWLANPRAVMPPTAMTVNFPPPTDSTTEMSAETQRQLRVVLELLIGWDQYLKRNYAAPTPAVRPVDIVTPEETPNR